MSDKPDLFLRDTEDRPIIPVSATRNPAGHWTLRAALPCIHGEYAIHGGGDDDEPFMGDSTWGSHCASFTTVRLALVEPGSALDAYVKATLAELAAS